MGVFLPYAERYASPQQAEPVLRMLGEGCRLVSAESPADGLAGKPGSRRFTIPPGQRYPKP